MNASIAVLKLGNQGVVGIADYYESSTPVSYYSGDQEVRSGSLWHGKATDLLGLSGTVESSQLCGLMLGRNPINNAQLVKHRRKKTKPNTRKPKSKAQSKSNSGADVAAAKNPENGERTTRNTGKTANRKRTKTKERVDHVPGVDLTFSVPKTVSALWAVADEDTAGKIEACCIEAVKDVLNCLESTVPLGRSGKGGHKKHFVDLATAIFRHVTARNNNDPQLHFHCVIPNVVRHVDTKKWSRLDSLELHKWTRTLGPLFRNYLSFRLQSELGLELYRPDRTDGTRVGWFEVRGIPEALKKLWSSRSQEIGKTLQLYEGWVASIKAKQTAALLTRQPKGEELSLKELYSNWREQADQHNFDKQAIRSLLGKRQPDLDANKHLSAAISQALHDLTKEQAHFEKRKFIQLVSEAIQDLPISGSMVIQAVDKAIQEQKEVLTLTNPSGHVTYTTPAMWNLERKLLDDVKHLSNQNGAVVSKQIVEKQIAKRPTLRPEQQEAARALMNSESSIRSLVGIAGSGKSYCLDTVREGFQAAGYKVIGGALSGIAKEELRAQANIPSRTVASYLYHLDKPIAKIIADNLKHTVKQICRAAAGKKTYRKDIPKLNSKTVVILDEAGMIGTRSMSRLVHHVKKSKATLILVGDPKQLCPIEAGAPFKRILEEVTPAALTQNVRLQDPLDVRTASLIRKGEAAKAVQELIARDRLSVSETRNLAATKLLNDWVKDGNARQPDQTIILTQTREEAKEMNRICQFERLFAGFLTKTNIKLADQKFHEHDRIMFHKALRTKGIENGFRGTVKRIDHLAGLCTIELDQMPTGWRLPNNNSRLVTLTTEQLAQAQISLAYAATTHKMQGQTVDQTYVLLGGPMTSNELTYVQATRAKEFTKFYVDRPHAGLEYEQLHAEIARSRQKDLAHDQDRRPIQ